MAEYIDRENYCKNICLCNEKQCEKEKCSIHTAPAVNIVRCFDCQYSEPLERNCELNSSIYLHCILWRGDLTKNVWHKYKKYYKDYSLVEHDEFCSCGVVRLG